MLFLFVFSMRTKQDSRPKRQYDMLTKFHTKGRRKKHQSFKIDKWLATTLDREMSNYRKAAFVQI